MGLGGVASRKMKGLVHVVFSPPPQLLLLRNTSDDDDGSCDETLQIPLLFSEELSAEMRLSSFIVMILCANEMEPSSCNSLQ
jgi:hypothetical protein